MNQLDIVRCYLLGPLAVDFERISMVSKGQHQSIRWMFRTAHVIVSSFLFYVTIHKVKYVGAIDFVF